VRIEGDAAMIDAVVADALKLKTGDRIRVRR